MKVTINKKGFSLIELMIVVAIIGILAAIALPNFTRFQRKARQSEAKGLLGSYHTALKSSAAEIGCFKGNFAAIGFQPEGELYYRLSANENAGCPLPTATAGLTEAACIATNATCSAIGANYTKTWVERTQGPTQVVGFTVLNNTYLATSGGDLGRGAVDSWTIDQNKTLTNTLSGL